MSYFLAKHPCSLTHIHEKASRPGTNSRIRSSGATHWEQRLDCTHLSSRLLKGLRWEDHKFKSVFRNHFKIKSKKVVGAYGTAHHVQGSGVSLVPNYNWYCPPYTSLMHSFIEHLFCYYPCQTLDMDCYCCPHHQ